MLSQSMGPWLYVLVFAIVFCETGLVVTPFLPGDSLLFALGSMTTLTVNAGETSLDIVTLSALFLLATFLGDNLNYFIGKTLGPKLFSRADSKVFNQKHLQTTQGFYEKHGKKAVIMARFVPIVRTFVPFVAGVGRMPYYQFLGYSFVGSILWTQIFLWMGRYFGNLEVVKKNFEIVILLVICLSLLPGLISWYRARLKRA